MKNQKICLIDVFRTLEDTTVISFRANGRTWTFAPGDKITCFEGLKPLVQSGTLTSELFDLMIFDFETLQSVLPFEK